MNRKMKSSTIEISEWNIEDLTQHAFIDVHTKELHFQHFQLFRFLFYFLLVQRYF